MITLRVDAEQSSWRTTSSSDVLQFEKLIEQMPASTREMENPMVYVGWEGIGEDLPACEQKDWNRRLADAKGKKEPYVRLVGANEFQEPS